MVFDIRGRRKHVVRVVYAVLALLMGASLFLVVGPVNIASLIGGGSTKSSSTILNEQAERTEEKLLREPSNSDLLLSLTRTRLSAGAASAEKNPETGLPAQTAESLTQYERAFEAWDRYLKQTRSPNPAVANFVAVTYFSLAESGGTYEQIEENVANAAKAQRLAAEALPSLGSLSALAKYEYFAGDFAAGDKATQQTREKARTPEEKKEATKLLGEYRLAAKSFELQKKKAAKQRQEQSKEALQNPFGGLGTSSAPGG